MNDLTRNIRFIEEHAWYRRDADLSTVGISEFACEQLGEIVYVSLPDVGTSVAEGDVYGDVESTKTVSDVYSPCTGTVIEINEAVIANPGTLAADPYGSGWLIEVRTTSCIDGLSAADYAALVTTDEATS